MTAMGASAVVAVKTSEWLQWVDLTRSLGIEGA